MTQLDLPVAATGPGGFDEFVRDHRDELVRYATGLTRSAALAEDVVQEVLTRIYPRWDDLVSREGSHIAYVRRAVTNEYLGWRRRWSTRHIEPVEQERLDVHVVDPWSPQDSTLPEHVRRLPGQQRTAVFLRYYAGLDDREIAETMGCREGTVRAHISRGLAKLRSDLVAPVIAVLAVIVIVIGVAVVQTAHTAHQRQQPATPVRISPTVTSAPPSTSPSTSASAPTTTPAPSRGSSARQSRRR